jgi:hypothetical protein
VLIPLIAEQFALRFFISLDIPNYHKMKTIILLSFGFLMLNSCGTDDTPTPGTPPPSTTVEISYWIPNWADDTLVGVNPSNGDYDIIYSATIGDTSVFYRDGIKYYIWAQCPFADPSGHPDWFKENSKTYVWCCIGTTPFDTASVLFKSPLTSAMPKEYYNTSYNEWRTQHQVVMLSPLKPPFPSWVNGGTYTTAFKSYIH